MRYIADFRVGSKNLNYDIRLMGGGPKQKQNTQIRTSKEPLASWAGAGGEGLYFTILYIVHCALCAIYIVCNRRGVLVCDWWWSPKRGIEEGKARAILISRGVSKTTY